jgi:transposase-like protein
VSRKFGHQNHRRRPWCPIAHPPIIRIVNGKEEGRVQTRCIYNILGINREGKKDVLGMYVSQSEGANFWLGVITDLKQRGVRDLLIACIDGLKGFEEAIRTIFPDTGARAVLFTRSATR